MKLSAALSFASIVLPGLTRVSADSVYRFNRRAGVDPQTSLTLDPGVIASGFANDGQGVPTAGQVASLTSTNNFINFCLTVPNLPITNGKQITTGSCNPAPIGTIPSSSNMPSSKFTNPKNGDTISANTPFTISMAINNMQTGAFVNANQNYFAAPQQLNAQGQIIGHSHVVVEALQALDQTTATDPTKFAFFKGLNGVAQGGVLTADVAAGLPAGAYRLCSINTAANHQPAIVPIAQHGSLDDCVYFTASAGGAAAASASSAVSSAAVATDSAASAVAASTTAGSSATTTAIGAGASAASSTAAAATSSTPNINTGAAASTATAVVTSASDAGTATATATGQPNATGISNGNGNGNGKGGSRGGSKGQR